MGGSSDKRGAGGGGGVAVTRGGGLSCQPGVLQHTETPLIKGCGLSI